MTVTSVLSHFLRRLHERKKEIRFSFFFGSENLNQVSLRLPLLTSSLPRLGRNDVFSPLHRGGAAGRRGEFTDGRDDEGGTGRTSLSLSQKKEKEGEEPL